MSIQYTVRKIDSETIFRADMYEMLRNKMESIDKLILKCDTQKD